MENTRPILNGLKTKSLSSFYVKNQGFMLIVK